MTEAVSQKGKFGRMNAQNKNLMVLFAKEVVSYAKQVGVERFEVLGFASGMKNKVIDKITEISGVNRPTVTRIFYAYNNKMSYEENVSLATLGTPELSVPTEEKNEVDGKIKSIQIRTKKGIIPMYFIDGDYYFSINDLFAYLPISENNKVLRSSFSVRSRKHITIDGVSVICSEADKVLSVFKSYLSRIQEGTAKEELRFFMYEVQQTKTKGVQPLVEMKTIKPVAVPMQEVKPQPLHNEVTVSINREVKEQPKVQLTGKVAAQPVFVKEQPKQQVVKTFKEIREVAPELLKASTSVVSNKKTTLTLNENKELEALIRMMSDEIGYLSPEAKERLVELVQANGLVHTMMGTYNMINEIQKDKSLYFVNKIGQKIKERL